jgi:hypothetical protein
MFSVSATHSAAQVSDDATERKVVQDFELRVAHYLELRKSEAGTPPKPTASTEKLTDSEQELAARTQAARQDAKQGEIFTSAIAVYFRRQVAAAMKGPEGARIRASLRHSEPTPTVPLRVNQNYPENLPLQSTPPSLLQNLPLLPKELEYRIVGRDLVLLDTAPNIIVDLVPNAVAKP